jgi:hypothetical protein
MSLEFVFTDYLEVIAEYPGTNSVDWQGPTPRKAPNSWLTFDKQDNLVYDEPIPWPPAREALGAVLYANAQYSLEKCRCKAGNV